MIQLLYSKIKLTEVEGDYDYSDLSIDEYVALYATVNRDAFCDNKLLTAFRVLNGIAFALVSALPGRAFFPHFIFCTAVCTDFRCHMMHFLRRMIHGLLAWPPWRFMHVHMRTFDELHDPYPLQAMATLFLVAVVPVFVTKHAWDLHLARIGAHPTFDRPAVQHQEVPNMRAGNHCTCA